MDSYFAPLHLFIPGPTYIRPEIIEAGKLPGFGSRDKEARLRLEPIFKNLKAIAGVHEDYDAIIIPGTGTDILETSLRSLVGEKEKILCISNGFFGAFYYTIALANGKHASLLKFNPEFSFDLNLLEDALKQEKPSIVTITHNETSTGVLNNLLPACQLFRRYGVLSLVDGVSIFAGAPTDIEQANIGMYSTCTHKCLALPPGLGIAFISREGLEKAQHVQRRGFTTDILKHIETAREYQTLRTTPTSLVNQLWAQTNYIVHEEGIQERFQRHNKMKEIAHHWINALPEEYQPLSKPQDASPSLTCMRVPQDLDRISLKERMREKGYLIDTGLREIGIPTIRLAHMGDITPEMLAGFLSTLEDYLI